MTWLGVRHKLLMPVLHKTLLKPITVPHIPFKTVCSNIFVDILGSYQISPSVKINWVLNIILAAEYIYKPCYFNLLLFTISGEP